MKMKTYEKLSAYEKLQRALNKDMKKKDAPDCIRRTIRALMDVMESWSFLHSTMDIGYWWSPLCG